MEKRTSTTRALLACGLVAGPLYVAVTVVQALTRDGFDPRVHRFSLLTAGDLGWIHQANMVGVGVLTVLFAVGVSRVMREGRGGVWAPRLIALFGLAYLFGGLLTADPVPGFPPGTAAETVQTTLQGKIQNASRGVSTLLLLATSGVIASRLAAERRRGLAWLYGGAIPVVFAALTAVGVAIGGNPAAPAFLATPWIWVTALAVYAYRLAAARSDDALLGPTMPRAPAVG